MAMEDRQINSTDSVIKVGACFPLAGGCQS